MRTDRVHKARLIQDISEYLVIIRSHLYPVIGPALKEGYKESDILRWIICEELELIYGLFDICHVHNDEPYAGLHNAVQNTMRIGLSVYTSHYIKAPTIYRDNNQIRVQLIGRDLFIDYYKDINAPLTYPN